MNSSIQDHIKHEIDTHDVVLFMKGTKLIPQCGFSGRVASLLDYASVAFHDVNILDSDDLRQGIKDFSDWPTIPQLYVKGKFVGGCDIIIEMVFSGELEDLLKEKNLSYDDAAFKTLKESQET